MALGVVYQDAGGRIIASNPAAEQILGLSRAQMEGKTSVDPDWRSIHEDGSAFPGETHPAMAALRTGEPQRKVIMGVFNPARGEHTWIEIDAIPQFRPGETTPYRVYTTFADITDRKRAEEERRALEEKIRQTQKAESLSTLAGGVAHDFNNLLHGILGNASLALMDLPRRSPFRGALESIERTSLLAAELAKQMLAYSGKGAFHIERVDLSGLVAEMKPIVTASVSKKASLEWRLPRGLPPVEADIQQLQQVLMSLVDNASESLGDTEGEIAVATGVMACDRGLLDGAALSGELPGALPEGEYVYLHIADTGCGIENDPMKKNFDPFFSTKFTGRGLGLAAVAGIVRGHRGTVTVSSAPGKGSSFRVLLPASDTAPPVGIRQEGFSEPWTGTGTVLLVDDEQEVRHVVREMLRQAGFDVLSAGDGVEAVDIYEKHRHQITMVLLDLKMPRMGGEEAFDEIRRINPKAIVVLSSGYSESEATMRFRGKELAGFIQKPYRCEQLTAVLRNALR